MASRLVATLAFASCLAVTSTAVAQSTWRLTEGSGPTREEGGLCFDERRGELVRWNSPYETWVHGGDRWERRVTPSAPPVRAYTLMAYDAARALVVLAAGDNKFDTWEWNGANWAPRGSDQAILTNRGAIGYDRNRQRVVLTTDSRRTFEWSGTAWTQTATLTVGLDTMTWDSTRGRLVGLQSSALVEYTGAAWASIGGASLPGGAVYQLAFDDHLQQLVAIGAQSPGPAVYHRIGLAWNPIAPPTRPGLHTGSRAVYHPYRERIVYGGGSPSFGATADYWQWDGSQWSSFDGAMPPGRVVGAAYDSARQRVVAHGIVVQGTVARTSEWDGRHWLMRTPANPLPAYVNGPMVYDEPMQRSLLVAPVGGFLTTWAWNGTDWAQLAAANPPPDGGLGIFAMAYDSTRQRVVLFTGTQTWLFDGAAWTQAAPTAVPPSALDRTLAHDPVRQRTVMYSGVLQDTWEWDGSNWVRRFPTVVPSFRTSQCMTWNPLRQRVSLTGGHYFQNLQPLMRPADLWEWDGTNWVSRATVALPAQSSGLFLHAGDGLLLHIGSKILNPGVAFEPTSETWLLRDAPLASATVYGSGCAAAGTGISLDAQFVPHLGNPEFALRVPGAPPLSGVLLAYGAAQANLPLGNGCTQLVDSILTSDFVLSSAGGEARFVLPIPADTGLLGIAWCAQAALLGSNGPLDGLSLTAGLRFQLGN